MTDTKKITLAQVVVSLVAACLIVACAFMPLMEIVVPYSVSDYSSKLAAVVLCAAEKDTSNDKDKVTETESMQLLSATVDTLDAEETLSPEETTEAETVFGTNMVSDNKTYEDLLYLIAARDKDGNEVDVTLQTTPIGMITSIPSAVRIFTYVGLYENVLSWQEYMANKDYMVWVQKTGTITNEWGYSHTGVVWEGYEFNEEAYEADKEQLEKRLKEFTDAVDPADVNEGAIKTVMLLRSVDFGKSLLGSSDASQTGENVAQMMLGMTNLVRLIFYILCTLIIFPILVTIFCIKMLIMALVHRKDALEHTNHGFRNILTTVGMLGGTLLVWSAKPLPALIVAFAAIAAVLVMSFVALRLQPRTPAGIKAMNRDLIVRLVSWTAGLAILIAVASTNLMQFLYDEAAALEIVSLLDPRYSSGAKSLMLMLIYPIVLAVLYPCMVNGVVWPLSGIAGMEPRSRKYKNSKNPRGATAVGILYAAMIVLGACWLRISFPTSYWVAVGVVGAALLVKIINGLVGPRKETPKESRPEAKAEAGEATDPAAE